MGDGNITRQQKRLKVIFKGEKKKKAKKGARGMPVALGGEEGRDKLRKAAGRGKYPLIRGYPNGATHRHRSVSVKEANAGN